MAMRPEIRQLLDVIALPEFDNDKRKRPEIVQIAFLFEISNGYNRNNSEYQTFLSDDQRKMTLPPEEQHEIVQELLKLVEKGHRNSISLIWAVGKATHDVIISLFQDFFLSHYTRMDNELIYQSIIAFQNGTYTEDRNVLAKLKFDNLKAMLQMLSHSSDERITEQTQYCLAGLNQILDRMDG
jgi:hypothetical protein